MIWTVNEIKKAMREKGSHWFDPDTMRFFGTRVDRNVYQGTGGVYFVTSEWDGFRGQENGRRAYTVRQFTPDTCDIRTVDQIGKFPTLDKAKRQAKKLAGDALEKHSEAFKPISELEQFTHDLRAHGCEGDIDPTANALMLLASRHQRLCEEYCNGKHNERTWGRVVGPTRKRISQSAELIGCKDVIFSGDPRGCTVKLVLPDGYCDDWGKTGLCVPRYKED